MMRIIGLTGGIGSGKSYIANILKEQYNADIFLTDDIAKKLLMPNGYCYNELVKHFGRQILDDYGQIDKLKLSHEIFTSEENRLIVNNIVHPAVIKYIKDSLLKTKKSIVVIESALLIESELDKMCTELWYVYADKSIRINRLMNTRGYSKEKCEAIIKSQLDFDSNRELFDVIIDNSGNNNLSEIIWRNMSTKTC